MQRGGENRNYMKNDEILLESINKRLGIIETMLAKLPEVQAITYLMMKEEYETARLQGKRIKDLWDLGTIQEV